MPLDLNDPEVKAALKAAAEEAAKEARAELADSVAKLEENNKLLTKQLREQRAKAATEVDPAEHAKLQERLEELTSALAESEKTYKKQVADLQKQAEQSTKLFESEQGFTQKLLRDNGLTEALMKAGVEPTFMKAVKAMLQDQVQIVADGDNRKAVVGDKALADFVTEWASSDEGKVYIKAPANDGGGAPGGNAQGGVKTISVQDKAAFGSNLEAIAAGKVKVEVPSS